MSANPLRRPKLRLIDGFKTGTLQFLVLVEGGGVGPRQRSSTLQRFTDRESALKYVGEWRRRGCSVRLIVELV
jgi:hypothetical protein